MALILAIAAPWLLSSYDLNLLARFLALSLTAMGLVLLWGEGGVLSLGRCCQRNGDQPFTRELLPAQSRF